LIQQLHGTLEVESERSHVSPGLSHALGERKGERMESAQILVVEDEGIVAWHLAQRLQGLGHTVPMVVASGPEAVRQAAAIRPDLVLMDIHLYGEMDGIEAAAQIRAQSDIPVVYLTAYADEPTLERAKVTEPFGYVLKPFEERELQITIEMALYKHRMERRLREREQWLATILTSIGEAVLATDLQGRVTFMNPAAEALTGWKQEDALGRAITDVCSLNDETAQRPLEHPVIQALREGTVVGMSNHVSLRAPDGRVTPVTNTAAPIHDEKHNITGAVLVFQDMSVRKRAEEALQAEMQIATALAQVGQELIAALDTPAVLDRLCQLTAEVLGCDYSHTWLWQSQEDAYVPVTGWGDSPEHWEVLRVLRLPRAQLRDTRLAGLEEGEMVQIEASSHNLPLTALSGQSGVSRMLCLALRRGNDLLGIQTAGYRLQQAPFTPTQERMARGIGQLASLALDNACLLEEAERANHLKSNFLATISHELRTPLSIIMGYTDLLLEGGFGPLAAEQSRSLRKVDQSARELLELIVAMLNISRLEMGRLPIEVTEVHIADLLAELEAELTARGDKPELRLIWQVAPDLPSLFTDRTKLKVILKNLLANAIKFTDVGEVRVTVKAENDGIEFSVSDTGTGIAPEVLPIIFEPFRQGEWAMTRQYGGLGVGLYVVRRLLETLQGSVLVRSEVGKGSSFRVWLPSETRDSAVSPG
jgi:PAS domain S-box-containing protein